MLTMQDAYAAALVARGCKEVQSRSRRYRCFTALPGSSPTQFYFLGKNGSVRVGRCRTESIPVSDRIKRLLLTEGRAPPEGSVEALAKDLGL